MTIELQQLGVIKSLVESTRSASVFGPWASAKSLIAVQVAHALGCPLLLITSGRIASEDVYEDVCTFAGADKCALLPAWEVLPTDAMAPADDIVAERMNTLKNLASAITDKKNLFTVIPVRSLMQYVPKRERLSSDTLTLAKGEEHDLEDLLLRLAELGYNRELMVEQRGEMSLRGGIFDIFPISGELPYRLEFFGDEIESIRTFEPETQRSVEDVEAVDILPRSEKNLLKELAATADGLESIADYLPPNTLVVFDEPMAVRERAEMLEQQYADNKFAMTWGQVLERLGDLRKLSLAQVAHDVLKKDEDAVSFTLPTQSMMSWAGSPDAFWEQLEIWDRERFSVVLMCLNTGERQRLHELLEERGYRPGQDSFDLRVEIGRIRGGFSSREDKLAVLSEREMFGRRYVRRVRRRFQAGSAITAFGDLKAGDHVVHAVHGVGCYGGLRRFAGKSGDFISISYQGGDILYVPVSHIDMVQKYTASENASPKVDKLGGKTWARKKARVKKAVRDMTEELLKLYATRESQDGHAFSPDKHWQHEFEDSFEYDETPDQARAIVDVKTDMESPKPMDRLICGDVGYGKTEVAIRAAFKAVMDGKQVALLVPTTVLAQQHYCTFLERLADYPMNVGILSRFCTPKQQRQTIEQLASGEVDIVIGTHRLTSKDIKFKDLGLVVIDEEQRFGVAQKERLKQLRTSVDVLTMSATPIPRTLHLSLMGVRDMSIINTAPNDRLPIHTCVDVFDEEVVSEAIKRELARGGQVFFLHNRVRTIEAIAEIVKKLVPNARVAIGHGQMHEHAMEKVMAAFIRKEVDVLVCTTIIGSGVDIPNANTIIINRADMFGLAELYQLRGRVGRYKHRAFAYLLAPGDRALTEEAQKRLKALEEASTLGAGYRLALHDLEIRGCGNILGGQQHGHIASVGYETYGQLIAETVQELKGKPVERRVLPPFDIAADAHIPEQYVQSESQKVTLYKRIAGVHTVEDVEEMADELKDRFGPVPGPVKRLLDIMRTRTLGADIGAERISVAKQTVSVELASLNFLDRKNQNTLRQIFGVRISFTSEERPCLKYKVPKDAGTSPLDAARKMLETLSEL